ncbi:hypothetical protein GCM10023310_71090 [Paenibacillus vulneris]|uniref:Uncharacterized protein n=1 Tax=Paenibacillus vulneris TaxID=1133364 RepID=A0ABW3UGM1_9BACL
MGQLTISSINKAHTKEFNVQEKVFLKNGDHILIQKKFKRTSIQRLILDYQDILDQLRKKEITMEVVKDITFIYYMLLLRHFTNLSNIPSDIEKMVIVCEKLIDLDLLDEIMGHFLETELEKVQNMIKQVSDNSHLISDQMREIFSHAIIQETVYGEEVEL